MRNGIVLWLICTSLVFTRLVGLHLHACACVEAGVERTGIHYADNGLVFGEHHDSDDEHDVELDASLSLAAKIKAPLDDGLALPAAVVTFTDTRSPSSPHSARGPPAPGSSRPDAFAPPPRGPPVSLA